MTLHKLVFSSPAQIVLAKLFVRHPGFKNVINYDQNLMTDGDQCPFLPSSSYKTVILRTEICVLRLRRRPGTLGHNIALKFLLPWVVFPLFLPALSLLPGLIPAQTDRWPSPKIQYDSKKLGS